jgi:hypothetical protein
MDDFYTEMRLTLEDIETSNFRPETIRQDYNILQEYFPSMFAEALVPVNPMRWPSFIAGSAMASDMPEFADKIKTPFENLVVAKEYLETSHSDVQWRDRLWQVAEDTTTINLSSELGDVVGSFGAGAASNKIADRYMDEMIDTAITLTDQERLNAEIFKQIAKSQGINPCSVRGTGTTREFVPPFMQSDLCDRLERYARPFDDDNSNSGKGLLEDGIIFNSNKNYLDPSGDFIFESSSSLAENQKSFFSRFFDFFGGVSDNSMCPVNTDYDYDSPFFDKLCDMVGFFIPEDGGGVCPCTDPSKMMPPSPFVGDLGGFYSDS